MFSMPFLNIPFFNNNNQKSTGINGFFNIFNTTGFDEPIFDIFGIDLYLDDLLILCILFTLYINQVHDNMLFISLLLLLINT